MHDGLVVVTAFDSLLVYHVLARLLRAGIQYICNKPYSYTLLEYFGAITDIELQ